MPGSAVLAAFTACLLWAVSFIATKVALGAVPPLTVVCLRLVVSALCFAAWLWLFRIPRVIAVIRENIGLLFTLSLLGTGLHYGTQTVGLQFTTASNASLFTVTGPITIAVLGLMLLGERLTVRKIVGILLAVTGVLVVIGGETLSSLELGGHVMGDLLVLASIVMWGIFTVLGKKITDELGALLVTAAVTVIGAVSMLPAAAWELRSVPFDLANVRWEAWLSIAFLGVGCSFLATLLYFVALQRSEAQKVGVFLYTIPPMTVLTAHLVLGEVLGLGFVLGSLLVFFGVFLTERSA